MTVSVTLANNPAPPGTTSGSGLAIGGLFQLTGVEDSLTAHAGGTQAAALALSATKNYHRISVCATDADSVALPAATPGQQHFVRNDGAKYAQVFGIGTDTIDGIATATGQRLLSGEGRQYTCLTAGQWVTDAVPITEGTFTPVPTGLTVVGAPTYTGHWIKIGRKVHVTLGVSAATSTASTAGTTSFTAAGLPAQAASGAEANGSCVAVNQSTQVGYGVGYVVAKTIYTPTWPAVANVAVTADYISAE